MISSPWWCTIHHNFSYVDFSFCWCICRQLILLTEPGCCCRLAFIQPTAGLLQVWGKGDLLHCLLVLWYSMSMLWSLGIPSMPYGSMPIGWNGLSMPTEGCSVCMPIVITNFNYILHLQCYDLWYNVIVLMISFTWWCTIEHNFSYDFFSHYNLYLT